MREIIFRGKRTDNDEWVKGDLLQIPSENWTSIMEQKKCTMNYIVDAETIGQYTGLCDKNGTRIFEGDIVMKRSNYSGNTIIAVVTYSDACFLAMVNNNSGFGLDESNNLEVIGNIYDNPELLKGAEK